MLRKLATPYFAGIRLPLKSSRVESRCITSCNNRRTILIEQMLSLVAVNRRLALWHLILRKPMGICAPVKMTGFAKSMQA